MIIVAHFGVNREYGRAVAYMQKAVGEVPEKPKGRFTDAAFQSFVNVYGAERDELVKLAKAYASDNDAIYYDRVPPESEVVLPAEGRSLMKAVPYAPPAPIPVPVKLAKSPDCLLQ